MNQAQQQTEQTRPRQPLVLVVEDHEDTRLLLRDILRHAGYLVELAPDGTSGLERAQRGRPPDLVVLDLGLPDVHGLEVLERLRQDPRTRRLAVLVFTAQGESAAAEQARAYGVAVLNKPADPRRVVEAVRQLLAKKRGAGDSSGSWRRPVLRKDLLVAGYLRKLPGRLAELEERCGLWGPGGDLEPPSRLAHRLVGSAGLHGLTEVAEAARRLEHRLRALEGGGYLPAEAQGLLSPLHAAVAEALSASGPAFSNPDDVS